MNAIAALIGGLFTYFIVWLVMPTRKVELPEAEPYTFERDKPVPDANETFEAWANLRRQIDIEKREGAI